jgi:hypothetical protein
MSETKEQRYFRVEKVIVAKFVAIKGREPFSKVEWDTVEAAIYRTLDKEDSERGQA